MRVGAGKNLQWTNIPSGEGSNTLSFLLLWSSSKCHFLSHALSLILQPRCKISTAIFPTYLTCQKNAFAKLGPNVSFSLLYWCILISLSLNLHCLFIVYIFVLPPETLLFEDNTAFQSSCFPIILLQIPVRSILMTQVHMCFRP